MPCRPTCYDMPKIEDGCMLNLRKSSGDTLWQPSRGLKESGEENMNMSTATRQRI